MLFNRIKGHDSTISKLADMCVDGSFSGPYLFKGPEAVGKFTIAKILSKYITCLSSELDPGCRCGNCRIFPESPDYLEIDCGDNIIVINARHISVTGRKASDKKYYRYTGFPGGLRERTFQQMMDRFPERVIEHAVRGMIPHNRLGRKMFKKLHVYADDKHPHQAQKPEVLELT